ncbi:hypothetical protein [Bacteroides faecis]|uniref:hypothetical protein n=1 Tax=Bacteroides faecis TaxID=674529 RepID=UPI0018A057F9|nr:hypothetical protein [Bacteroides faecis]MCB6631411.1 hypothetical protein [Bacteroides faecis]MCE8943740.1 hypothetical protein [Bacteroides faecis]MCS2576528.1 hypothetical protein [Bacteroides faecis]MCS3325713.1 hypothetical protein [Bacteroides faecis]UVR63284.1 hypothetical protein NXW26_17075 [Bacteroides faecis]
MRKLRRRGTGISAKGVCHAFGTSVPHRWHNRAKPVAQVFPACGTIVSGVWHSWTQWKAGELSMLVSVVHNA